MHEHNTNLRTRGVLATLRAVVPLRELTFSEALRIAELQANRLLEIWQVDDFPVPREVVSEVPRLQIVAVPGLPVSGSSHWSGTRWIISLNADEPRARQRFTLLHEFKHIIDHGRVAQLYGGNRRHSGAQQAELAADYFAGCVLMPKRLLKRAWCDGQQTPSRLGRAFGVSARAAEVRLAQTGLTEDRARCSRAPVERRPFSAGRYTRAPLERARSSA